VRGTVRSARAPKAAFLSTLTPPGARHKLEVVEADLTADAGWAAAVAGATYVMHVASPFPIASPTDPARIESELVRPAVDGALRLLRAVADAPSPRPLRVVMTSSVGAIAYGHDGRDLSLPFTDTDWTNLTGRDPALNGYYRSKTMAERAAWDYVASLPADKRFELTTICPGAVQGPLLGHQDCTRWVGARTHACGGASGQGRAGWPVPALCAFCAVWCAAPRSSG
jgi:dihydroflavonol-4-reductase